MAYGAPEKLIGTVLDGTYKIDRVVGEGAFGAVYAATHLRLKRQVAVKVLRAVDADAFARFRREAEVTSSLGSRFIAQVFDFNTMPGGEPYLVMELLDGEDLAARLARVKTIGLSQALKIAEQVASALAVAHKHKIVHRDLKPQNVFLTRSEDEGEVVKVIDFGIAKLMSTAPVTAAGQFLGSPLYMSPEQVRGRSDQIDERTDVYALGAVVYEALAGRPPFQASSVFELVEKISGPDLPPKLAPGHPEIPPALDEVLARALAKSRDDRPKTVTDLYNQLANVIRTSTPSESATPAAAIVGTHALETMHITGSVATPLWRGRTNVEDQLRFVAPEGGFYPNDFRSRTLKITGENGKTEYFLGSVPLIDGITNDCVLPHRQVSRNAARVVVRGGRVWLRREPKCNVPVRVGLLLLERDEERPLHHGQPVAIGVVAGVFHDGRYVPSQAPAQAVDEQTGLLGREGLAWELALAARVSAGRRLLLAAGVGALDDEVLACKLAIALHEAWPVWPVARFRGHVGALVPPDGDAERAAQVMRAAAGVPLAIGTLPVGSSGDQAGARIDEARGALGRVAASVPAETLAREVIDLAQYALRLLEPAPFVREAQAILARGGESGLIVMDDQDQLRAFGEPVVAALELELLQITGRIAGATAVLCRPAAGAVGFAGPDAAEPIARQVAREWHSRGPVRGEVVEVERGVSTSVVGGIDLVDLPRLAAEMVAGGLGAGVDALPLPIAARVRAALTATDAPTRAEALIEVVASTWKLIGISLASMALAGRSRGAEPFDMAMAAGTPGAVIPPVSGPHSAQLAVVAVIGPWRQVAINAAAALTGTPGRVGELVAALFDGGGPRAALATATEEAVAISTASAGGSMPRGVDRLERAVADLLMALRPLRGWTLIHVDRVDRVDVFGDCETVHYIDYTGTYERGTPRQVTLVKDLRMGPFAYLTRLAEGIVVPLEPHLRHRHDPHSGVAGLFWAEQPIVAPGVHRYGSVLHGTAIDDEVTAKQIPKGRR